jgi:hypothetical protein
MSAQLPLPLMRVAQPQSELIAEQGGKLGQTPAGSHTFTSSGGDSLQL